MKLVGAHLRYFVHCAQGQILACLLWTSPAWKMAARDRWIGWNADQRARNLQYIVNNSRFLILPWVQVKALASTILARSARQVPHDWCQHYGYTPLLLETLVDVTRFNGTCYRAANWIALGQTTGRGRMDRHHKEAILSAIDQNESEIEINLARADAVRQSILKKAFAGQLVEQDPKDEPASVILARIKSERGDLANANSKIRNGKEAA